MRVEPMLSGPKCGTIRVESYICVFYVCTAPCAGSPMRVQIGDYGAERQWEDGA